MPWINSAERNSLNLDPVQNHYLYNGLDGCVTYEVFKELEPLLDEYSRKIYTFERELQAPIMDMIQRGVRIDNRLRPVKLQKLREENAKYQAILNEFGQAIWDRNINPESFQQLKALFYDRMGIPPIKVRKGKKWAVSCDREALEKMREQYLITTPIVNLILEIRDNNGLIEMLERGVDPDGRMRCSYNIPGTTTGRLSSSKNIDGTGGNLQNIKETIRDIFIADKGYKMAYTDLEQAESRTTGLLAYIATGLDNYLRACYSGDLHTLVCKLVWPQLSWTGDAKEDRKIADGIFYRIYSYRDMSKKGGHGCLTPDHEVLTPDGWVPISEMPPIIMTWNIHEESTFSTVEQWTNFEYTGTIHEFESNCLSVNMTSDHRIPYTYATRPIKLKTKHFSQINRYLVSEAKNGPKGRIPLGGGYVGGNVNVPARLIAAIMQFGIQKDENTIEFPFTELDQLYQFNQFKILLEKCNIPYSVKHHNGNITVNATLPKFAGAFMFSWTKECLEEFFDEFNYRGNNLNQSQPVRINSDNLEHLTWLQTFARLVGISGTIRQCYTNKTKKYTLSLSRKKFARAENISWKGTPHPNGIQVYCPTVPSSYFYIRRNGKISVTGNSNYGGSDAVIASHLKVKRTVARDFQTNYFAAFPEIKLLHTHIEEQLKTKGYIITPFGRKRYFFSRLTENSTLKEAIAFGPQSLIADMINTTLIDIHRLYMTKKCPVQLLMQVHDAFVFQFPERTEEESISQVLACMMKPLPGFDFSIPADAASGWNWRKQVVKGGKIIENEYGLKKWKSGVPDTRKLQTVQDLIDGLI